MANRQGSISRQRNILIHRLLEPLIVFRKSAMIIILTFHHSFSSLNWFKVIKLLFIAWLVKSMSFFFYLGACKRVLHNFCVGLIFLKLDWGESAWLTLTIYSCHFRRLIIKLAVLLDCFTVVDKRRNRISISFSTLGFSLIAIWCNVVACNWNVVNVSFFGH